MKVSVVATVLNEGPAIEQLLESLVSQSRPPDEVVIVDGGSQDGTLDILREWSVSCRLPMHVLQEPGANISQGRNAAIAAAAGDVIAVTDAGVRLTENWLRTLVDPFEQQDGSADYSVAVVSGWFVADPHSLFETAMGVTVLPHVREVRPETFLPSSRSVAFRRAAWEAVGGYPEWLDYCEDVVFDLQLRELYPGFAFAPEAKVSFRPRGKWRAFFLQYFRYARGDGKADLWRRRHAIRYLTYLAIGPGLVALALAHSPLWGLVLLAGLAVYTATPYRRLWQMMGPYGRVDRARVVLLVPLIRIVGDVAKMIGYPVGLVWRWRNWHQTEIHWR